MGLLIRNIEGCGVDQVVNNNDNEQFLWQFIMSYIFNKGFCVYFDFIVVSVFLCLLVDDDFEVCVGEGICFGFYCQKVVELGM